MPFVCIRAPPVRQEGGTASRTTDNRLSSNQRHPAHDASLEDVPAGPGPGSCGGVPVHLDPAIRGYHDNGKAGRHTYLPDADNCTGETRGEVSALCRKYLRDMKGCVCLFNIQRIKKKKNTK